MPEAELARFIDRFTVEYVRVYPHPIERLWRAITMPAEFAVWFLGGDLQAHLGGRYRFGPENSTDFAGPVLAVEPPRLIRFGGPTDDRGYFQYELSEVAGGTRMRFIQYFPPGGAYSESPGDLGGDLPGGPDTPWKPAFVGGWHEFWDALADYLDGVPVGSRLPPTEFGALAEAWARVEQQFGELSAERAAHYVHGLRRTERWNELNEVYREHIRSTLPPA